MDRGVQILPRAQQPEVDRRANQSGTCNAAIDRRELTANSARGAISAFKVGGKWRRVADLAELLIHELAALKEIGDAGLQALRRDRDGLIGTPKLGELRCIGN